MFDSLLGITSRATVCAAALLLAACSDDKPGRFESGALPLCNIALPGCQRAIYSATARLRGQDRDALPEIRTMDIRDIEADLRAEYLDAEPTIEELRWRDALAFLGLVPAEQPLGEASIQNFLANVGAYYESNLKRITIVDRGFGSRGDEDAYLLAHEFVHALQDQRDDLIAYQERWGGSNDSDVAISALIEGEATLLSTVLYVMALGQAPQSADWEGYVSELSRSARERVQDGDAPLLQALQLLPYSVGTQYLYQEYLERGQPAVDAVWSAPPTTLVDWVNGRSGTGEASRTDPLDCIPSVPPPGYQVFDRDSLGFAGVFALLTGSSGTDRAWQLASEVHNDRLIVFEQLPDETGTPRLALAWRIRFSSADAAQDFGSIARVSGRPATAYGSEVLIRLADDAALLESWDGAQCGADPAPRPMPASARAALRLGRGVP